MRNVMGMFLLLAMAACSSHKSVQKASNTQDASQSAPAFDNYAAGPPAGTDTVLIGQPDDSRLHIIGFGNMFISYTETIDGYTLVLGREGVYQYALRAPGGDLGSSNINARDPKDRSKQDEAFLVKVPRHLRYEGKKLNDLLERQREWNEKIRTGKMYRYYKEQQQKEQPDPQNQQNNQDNQR